VRSAGVDQDARQHPAGKPGARFQLLEQIRHVEVDVRQRARRVEPHPLRRHALAAEPERAELERHACLAGARQLADPGGACLDQHGIVEVEPEGRPAVDPCDIAMGCNSQKSLQRFGAPNNGDLKVLDGLHAKIYVSRAGAVVGSANASTNGIGLTNGEERNMAAGVFFARDSTGWQQAIAFFEWCWKTSVPLDQTQLGRARTWARDPGPVIGPEGRAV
jgi:hypothetical protein